MMGQFAVVEPGDTPDLDVSYVAERDSAIAFRAR